MRPAPSLPAEPGRGRAAANVEPLLAIEGLTVGFDDGRRITPVLHGIDLTLARGESLGMVGESGCGKSVTWLAVLRLLGRRARIGGVVRFDGQRIDRAASAGADDEVLAPIRGRRIAMIFQDPSSSLNPVHRIGRQLVEALRLHRGLASSAAQAEALRLLDRVRIPAAASRLQAWPHQLSGGMNQRVMIAMALAGEPDLLVADEPTTALDVTVQAQILDLLSELRRESGMALVLVTHDLGVVTETCDRVVVLYAGRVVESAPAHALFDQPTHPYTRGLLAALPDAAATAGAGHASSPGRRLAAIPGTVPAAGQLPAGCAFSPRCTAAVDLCRRRTPALAPARQTATSEGAATQVACFVEGVA